MTGVAKVAKTKEALNTPRLPYGSIHVIIDIGIVLNNGTQNIIQTLNCT